MSFILDALKKSEAERQRQAGPTLLELRITRPRRRYPLWAAIVGVLLGVNVVVLLVLVLRRPFVALVEGPAPSAAPSAAAAVPAPPALIAAPGLSSPVKPVASAPRAAALSATPDASAALGEAGAAPVGTGSGSDNAGVGASGADQLRNPADDEPAVAPGRVQVQPVGSTDYANLPSSSELAGNLPPLQLDLLDYSDRPSERYALINMHRVREGDVLPEGARVLAITRDGVALAYRGQNFMLRPSAAAP